MRVEIVLCRVVMSAGLFLGTSSQSQAHSTPMEAARTFIAAFDAGDNAKAAAMMSSSGLVIVDEFAPYQWTGDSAFTTWMADLMKDAMARGLTGPHVAIGAPLVNTMTRDSAYLVCPMTYTYKLKGVPMREQGRMAMVLHKQGATWQFVSYSWAGTEPQTAPK